ncbi:MAG: glycosyltransferase family 2 protein [Puia sp.]|nr:glycosyltransferase family 2 protein [Puia sp.]
MNTNTPLVSICMPAYNAAAYIDETIRSILDQTYAPIELIIVNDGSIDGTDKVLMKYAGKPNIKIIHTVNRGQCAAANKAYEQATGEYIKFFDADDIMNPEHIEAQVKRVIDRPNCIAAAQVKRFYNDDLSTALHEPLGNWRDLKPVDWLVIDNAKGLGMMGACMFLIPRQILEASGLWNERLSLINDYEFSPRFLLRAEMILFTPDAKMFYRSGLIGSLSVSYSRERLVSAFEALVSTEALLLSYENSERVRAALSHMWHLWMYQFYLDAMDLYRKGREHLRGLGNVPDTYYKNAPGRVMRLVGWKNHKRLKRIAGRLKNFFHL